MHIVQVPFILFFLVVSTILHNTKAAKCYLKLNQICATNGNDGVGNELEMQVMYFNAKEDGQWYTLTGNTSLDIPYNGCTDVNEVVWVPDDGNLLLQLIEDDWASDDVYQVVHVDACNPQHLTGKLYETSSGTIEFKFSFWE